MAILLPAGLIMAATQATPGITANTITAAVMLSTSNAACALFNMTAITMRQRQVPASPLGIVPA